MPRLRTFNKRQRSKQSKGEFSDWHYGDVYQGCSYHPLKMIGITFYDHGGSVDGISLLDGSQQSCSLYNCGVYKMTEKEIEDHKVAWEAEGELGLMRLNGWSHEDAKNFMEVWR